MWQPVAAPQVETVPYLTLPGVVSMADVQEAAPVRSWQRRQLVWMLAVVEGAPTWLRMLVGWQPAPVAAQPVLVLVWVGVDRTGVDRERTGVARRAGARGVLGRPVALIAAEVSTGLMLLLWQFRHTLALVVLAEVASACSVVSDEPDVRMSWQAPHAVDANVVALACVEAVGWCLAASAAWACVVAV